MYGDISAYLHDDRKAYSGVGFQHGRLITDADLNAKSEIAASRNEALFRQIICPAASPDDGFRISNPALQTVALADGVATFDTYTFDLADGNFVLGGLRLSRGPQSGTGFTDQTEWLFQPGDQANYPPAPTDGELAGLPGERRTDAVYLEAAEYAVRGVEDREIQDRALGAADTTTRARPLGRTRVLPNLPDNCGDAADALRAALAAPYAGDNSGVAHWFSDDGVELLSKARLTIGFAAQGAPADPCQPRELAGYIGSENHTLRIMLTAANRFVFNVDHGEPLYRVQLSPEGAAQRVTFLTPPRDPVLFPVAGQIIEILPWAALLPNVEKTAEWRGYLAPITASYDPEDRFVVIDPPAPVDMSTWLSDLPAATLSPHDPPEESRYFYARIWQPPVLGAGPDTPFDTANAVTLADFGVELSFHAFGIPGDYWTVSLRTAAPEMVLPWRLMEAEGAPPMGPRRFYSVLGLVRWDRAAGGGDPVGTTHDCRERLRRLCEMDGCCTLSVGDGHNSHGVVDDLQNAIDLLPEDGGEICLLPGHHVAGASLVDRTMVTIHGCGPRTVVTHAAGQNAPVLTIKGGGHIWLHDFAIETDGVVGVSWRDAPERLQLTRLEVTAGGGRAVNGPTGTDVTIESCRFVGPPFADPLTSQTTAALRHLLVLGGEGIVVRDCWLSVPKARATLMPLGGIQIVGDSRDVVIRDNRVEGGNGFGIALGSYSFRRREVVADDMALARATLAEADNRGNGGFLMIAGDGCPEIHPELDPPDNGDGDRVLTSDGDVENVLILGNRIAGMGLSGISVIGWFRPAIHGIDTIETNRFVIHDNEIRNCVRLNLAANPSDATRQYAAHGGITLADAVDLVISRNRIEGCGTSSTAPVCGVFVRSGEEIDIADNAILDNGIIAEPGVPIRPGRSGGIVIAMVTSNLTRGTERELSARGPQNRAPALTVHGNRVVAREGRALDVMGAGPMAVADNQFAAYGANTLLTLIQIWLQSAFGDRDDLDGDDAIAAAALLDALVAAIAGATVTIINIGISQELFALGQWTEFQAAGGFEVDATLVLERAEPRLLIGGDILFNDNKVMFDALSAGISLVLCSVLLLTLDDVSMADNQCEVDAEIDFIAVDAVAIGLTSVRVQGNRFEESPLRTFYSALTMGLMNATENNQGTHCFRILGFLRPMIQSTVAATLRTNRHIVPEAWCERQFRLASGLDVAFPLFGQQAVREPVG
jgi:hypothetical protein